MTFKEKHSGITTVLNVTAYHKNDGYGPYQINTATYISGVSEAKATFYIPQNELNKIPIGGVWEAELKVNLMEWDPYIVLGNWNAHIRLNVTDQHNQQIYLPDFGTAEPHVDLNLRPLPGTASNHTMLSGSTSLDMCLYDGYDANSSTFTLNAQDQKPSLPDREPEMFSVYYHAQTDISKRIDYHIEILDPAAQAYRMMKNRQDYVIHNIQSVPARAVHLPGIPEPVLCVPSRLRLTTPAFAITSKQSGHYIGYLTLNLTTQM